MSLSPAEQMERSRSNSESVVNASSRAAKRMGFVVRKNQDLTSVAESSDSHHALTASPSSLASMTTTTRAPPPQLPPSLANGIPPNIGSRLNSANGSNGTGGVTGHARLHRGHARGVSHDSVMELSYSSQSVPSSDPLSTTSSASSTSSTTSHSNRERVDRVNRQLSAGVAGTGSANSGTHEIEPQPNAYFRRLSVLQEQMSPALLLQFSSAAFSSQVVESARGILFTLSQVLPALRQFLAFCDDRTLSGTLGGIIYNTRLHIDTLIRTLEHHDALLTSPGPGSNRRVPQQAQSVASAAIEPIIHAALACIGAFRHIISIVHANVKTLAARAEIRHTRAFFLLSYGALAEVRNAWTALVPALAECRVPVSNYLSREIFSSKTASRSGSKSPSLPPHPPASELMPPPALPPLATPNLWPQGPKSSGVMTTITSSIGTVSSPISAIPPTPGLTLPFGLFSPPTTATASAPATENGPYAFHFSSEPSETDEELFERIEAATQSAMNVLKLVLDGMAKVVDNNDTKMRELANMCDYGLDVTGRLRERLGTIRGADAAERIKFGEDTNAFVKGIISVLEFTKTILNDYPFLNDARPQLSSLTRVTKEVLTVTLKPAEKTPEKGPGLTN
ncbi:RAM signaling pathway protein-domain-containing protein [Lipomyces kononenkoae]|uniref:RAM signaling pathway protein-domain-containing protein n=1 Tax=Lipomyces kononenkoae TaxID=34357 RepID=A0ACC3T6I6_LIPKO